MTCQISVATFYCRRYVVRNPAFADVERLLICCGWLSSQIREVAVAGKQGGSELQKLLLDVTHIAQTFEGTFIVD